MNEMVWGYRLDHKLFFGPTGMKYIKKDERFHRYAVRGEKGRERERDCDIKKEKRKKYDKQGERYQRGKERVRKREVIKGCEKK